MESHAGTSRINVIVASASRGYIPESLAASVAARPDMTLVTGAYVAVEDVDAVLASLPAEPHCAVVLVGPAESGDERSRRWLSKRADLVVMLIDGDNIVRLAVGSPRLPSLLDALREFVERVNAGEPRRVLRIARASAEPGESDQGSSARLIPTQPPPGTPPGEPTDLSGPPDRPLLRAATEWLHHLLRDAIERVPSDNGDVHGLSLTRATLLQSLDAPPLRTADDRPEGLDAAADRLGAALAAAIEQPEAFPEPLAVATRTLALQTNEFRLLVLVLAPEIDVRFQRCLGFLLDEMGRRVGTFGLYAELLNANATIRDDVGRTGTLDRWLAFDGRLGERPPADEPLRVDPFLARWLLGEPDALAQDPGVRHLTRIAPWPGADLITAPTLRARGVQILDRLSTGGPGRRERWLLLDGADSAGWRALLEAGALDASRSLIRLDAIRLAPTEPGEAEEAGRRVARWSRLTGQPLIIDITRAEAAEGGADDAGWLASLLAAVVSLGGTAAVISRAEARSVRLLGSTPFELISANPLDRDALIEALRVAARGAEVWLSAEEAAAMASRYPLDVDGLEQVMRLARSRPLDHDLGDPRLERFMTAAKEVVGEGLSHLADRLEPVFDLEDVVLPADRKAQLVEIVDNVRLAHRVLDEWRFGARLPYGRGVTALFSGLSGTGKTMAAMGIARRLNIQLLRLDLSRVVSKFIGDTEKNIDRVFTDAQRSGAAILIDEADALLGKRSEVKDAHDRYANIEVAFLLQRMEAFDGLAILTTNMKQALDPSFLRRLRFIIDFPRPDADARERIWRLCLPEGTHTLDAAAFRVLARKIDVTGGHIRQITLRAAFIAAAAESQIALAHVARAANAELTKLGMPAVDLDPSSGRRAA